MAQSIHQRVGATDYKGTYEVKGDNVEVTIDGQTQSAAIGNQGALYKARDIVRMIVRDKEKKAA